MGPFKITAGHTPPEHVKKKWIKGEKGAIKSVQVNIPDVGHKGDNQEHPRAKGNEQFIEAFNYKMRRGSLGQRKEGGDAGDKKKQGHKEIVQQVNKKIQGDGINTGFDRAVKVMGNNRGVININIPISRIGNGRMKWDQAEDDRYPQGVCEIKALDLV